jgi:hypothetical protein
MSSEMSSYRNSRVPLFCRFKIVSVRPYFRSRSFPRVQDRYQKNTQSRSDLGQFLRSLGKLIVDIIPHLGKALYLI